MKKAALKTELEINVEFEFVILNLLPVRTTRARTESLPSTSGTRILAHFPPLRESRRSDGQVLRLSRVLRSRADIADSSAICCLLIYCPDCGALATVKLILSR